MIAIFTVQRKYEINASGIWNKACGNGLFYIIKKKQKRTVSHKTQEYKNNLLAPTCES